MRIIHVKRIFADVPQDFLRMVKLHASLRCSMVSNPYPNPLALKKNGFVRDLHLEMGPSRMGCRGFSNLEIPKNQGR